MAKPKKRLAAEDSKRQADESRISQRLTAQSGRSSHLKIVHFVFKVQDDVELKKGLNALTNAGIEPQTGEMRYDGFENRPRAQFFICIDENAFQNGPITMEEYENRLREASKWRAPYFACMLMRGIRGGFINVHGLPSMREFFDILKSHFPDIEYGFTNFNTYFMSAEEWEKCSK